MSNKSWPDRYCGSPIVSSKAPAAPTPHSNVSRGCFSAARTRARHSAMLELMVEQSWADPEPDVQLVPVTVMVGQRPSVDSGFTRIISFRELGNWRVGFKRLFSTLVNGRRTFVQFSRPISLQESRQPKGWMHPVR